MARKGWAEKQDARRKKAAERESFQDFSFVEMRLDKSARAEFQAYVAASSNELWDDLRGMLQSGYKLSVTYQSNNDCFLASLTCKGDGDPNEGLVLTSRSDDMIDAVLLGVYKTTVLCKDNTWPRDRQADNWG